MEEAKKKRVLIIEDDKLLALVEGKLISKLGYNVVGKASTGEEAVRMTSELNPDILVVDISLNGEMDGIETVENIREHSSIPVIYLSGNSDNFNFERAKKTGFVSYLVKPITQDELKAPLEKASSQDSEMATSASQYSIQRRRATNYAG
ncbi:MAG: response regulator [Balneolaceae bacterium]